MNYKIDINGIHCMGCTNLIAMTLEDEGLKNVVVSLELNTADFSSDLDGEKLSKLLDKAFQSLETYNYTNLSVTN